VFGDFFNPTLRALTPNGKEVKHFCLGLQVPNLASFGEDLRGELYAISLSGPVYRLAQA
jgi:hypothetical protein